MSNIDFESIRTNRVSKGQELLNQYNKIATSLGESKVNIKQNLTNTQKLIEDIDSYKKLMITDRNTIFEGVENVKNSSISEYVSWLQTYQFAPKCDPDSIKDTKTFQAYVNCLNLNWEEYKKLFDLDANGNIDKKELDIFLKMFRQLNKDIVKTKDVFITLKESVDRNNDKRIDKEELKLFLKIAEKHNWNIKNIKKEYKELDELVASTRKQIEQETKNKTKTKYGSGYSLLQLYGKTMTSNKYNKELLEKNIKSWGQTLTKNSPRNLKSFLTWTRQHGEITQKSSKSAGRTPRSQMGSSTGKVVVHTNLTEKESKKEIRAKLLKLMTGRGSKTYSEFLPKRWPKKQSLQRELNSIYTELSARPKNGVVKIRNFENVWSSSRNSNIKALKSYSEWNPPTTPGTSSGSSQETKKCVMPSTEGNEKIQINTYQELYNTLKNIRCEKLSKRRFNEKYVLKGEIQQFMDQKKHIHKNSSRLRLFYNVDVIMSNLVSEHNVEINVPN